MRERRGRREGRGGRDTLSEDGGGKWGEQRGGREGGRERRRGTEEEAGKRKEGVWEEGGGRREESLAGQSLLQ